MRLATRPNHALACRCKTSQHKKAFLLAFFASSPKGCEAAFYLFKLLPFVLLLSFFSSDFTILIINIRLAINRIVI
jgi:hypothetical protein